MAGLYAIVESVEDFFNGGNEQFVDGGGGSIGEDDTILFLLAVGCVGLCCGRSSGPATRIIPASHAIATIPPHN